MKFHGVNKAICWHLLLSAVAVLSLAFCLLIAAPTEFASAQSQTIFFDSAISSGELSGGSTVSVQPELLMSSSDLNGAESGEIVGSSTTIQNKGRTDNRVDVVFLGDGYKTSELSLYAAQVNSLRSQFFAETPLYQYQNYFNVHRVDLSSAESGVDHDSGYGSYRDTILDMQYWCQGAEDTLCISVSKALQAAMIAPDADQIIALANSGKMGGAAYPYSDLALVSATNALAGQNLLHQFGHSFANLADEYDTGAWPEFVGAEPAEPNVSALTAAQMTQQKIKWHKWLGFNAPATMGGLVGSHEGAMGYKTKIYRPTGTSKMRTLGQPFNMPSIESFIIETYRHIDPIDDATPASAVPTGDTTLFVTPMQPLGHNLDVQWLVNGQPAGTGNTLRLEDIFELRGGQHQVSVNVADNTTLVRDEESRDRFMKSTRSWAVVLGRTVPQITQEPADKGVLIGQTATYNVTATGGGLRYQWMRNGLNISGATKTSYTTPFAVRADDQSKYSVRVYNSEGSATSREALLYIINRLPVLTPVSPQNFGWKESKLVTLTAADADGDTLTYSASVSGAPSGIIKLVDNKLTIGGVPGGYLGNFEVTVGVTDGYSLAVTQKFSVTMSNRKPSLAAIGYKRIAWSADPMTIQLTGTDADGDPLEYYAQVQNGVSVEATVAGNVLTLDPKDYYIGVCQITAIVSDGLNSASQVFSLEVYNNAPKILPIADQIISRLEPTRVVAAVATDANNDVLTYTATARASSIAYDLDQIYNFARLEKSWHANLVGQNERYFQGYHPETSQLLWFAIKPSGELYIWEGSFAKSAKIATLPTAYHLDPSLLFDVPEPGASVPVALSVEGANLSITPDAGYRGSFTVTVQVDDGIAQDQTEFLVTKYDSKIVLNSIADVSRHWKNNGAEFDLVAVDSDGNDNQQLPVFSSNIYDYTNEYLYQLTRYLARVTPEQNLGITDNMLGYNEIYFFSNGNNSLGAQWFSLTPHGALFEHNQNHTQRKLVAYLNPLFYRVPELLLRSSLTKPAVAHEAQLVVNENQLSFLAPSKYVGKVFVETTASDGTLADSRVNLIDVFNHAPEFNNDMWLQNRVYSYKSDRGTFKLMGGDADSDSFTYSATLTSPYESARRIDLQYSFDSTHPTLQENYRGWSEKYLRGYGPNGELLDFFILPNGELYELVGGSVTSSRFVGYYTSSFWYNPSLYGANNPEILESPATISLSGDLLTVYPTIEDYLGVIRVAAMIHDGQGWSYREVYVEFRDLTPWLEQVPTINMHWREQDVKVDLVGHDPENEAIIYSAVPYDYTWIRNTSNSAQFRKDWADYRFNHYGRQEKSFKATLTFGDLDQTVYYITPNGRVHRVDGPSLDQHIWSFTVPYPFYENPELLFDLPPVPTIKPMTLTVEGNRLTVDPEEGFRGPLLVEARVHDARSFGRMVFCVNVYNNAPELTELPEVYEKAWNTTGGLSIPLTAIDPDGAKDDLSYSASFGSLAHRAFDLDQIYNFSAGQNDWRYNYYGWQAKHFTGTYQGQPAEFAILPGGALYRFDSTFPNSQLLGRFSPEYYENLTLLFNVAPQEPLPQNVSLVLDAQNVVRITPPAGWTGAFDLTVEVTDGNLHDFQTTRVIFANRSPVLGAIGPKTIHWTEEGVELNASATDADNDPLTYSVSIYSNSALDALTKQWKFQRHPSGYFLNLNGKNEKYVYALDSSGVQQWFYILPQGGIYSYQGSINPNNFLANTPELFHTSPDYLFSGSVNYAPDATFTFKPAENSQHQLSVNGNKISVKQDPGYWGSLLVTVKVSDGYSSDSETIAVNVINGKPVQPVYNETTVSWTAPYGERALTVTQTDSDPLSYKASLGGVSERKYALDQKYDFRLDGSADNSYNRLGWRDKWLKGTADGEEADFVILPTGKLLHWMGSMAQSEHLGWVEASDFAEPSALVNYPKPATQPEIEVLTVGGVLRVDPPQGFVGTVVVTGSADDSVHNSNASLQFTFKNNLPVLATVANQRIHVSKDYLDLTLTGSDADNDPLTYSAAIVAGDNTAAVLAIDGNVLRINPRDNFLGIFTVRASVSDGFNAVTKEFTVDVYNNAPSIATIANQTWGWRTTSKTLEISASDLDGDSYTLAASVSAAHSALGQVTLSGTTLTVTPKGSAIPYSFVVNVDATDNWSTSRKSFTVTISNTAPSLAGIANQTVKWTSPVATVDLVGSDVDGDPLTYSARIASGKGSFSLNGTKLTVTPDTGVIGSVVVVATVSDTKSEMSRGFSVIVANAAPVIKPIENQAMGRGDRERTVRIFVSDADKDPLTVRAELKAGSNVPVRLAATETSVEITLLEDFIGDFPVVVLASDGNIQTNATFNVSIGNWPPTLELIANQVVYPDSGCFDVELEARDPDGDGLTFTAEPYQPQRWAYDLDRKYNFGLAYGNYFYNLLGNHEKYIQGTSSTGVVTNFVIYPTGNFYLWTGRLSNSQFLGRMDIAYYDNPSLLFDVADAGAASVSVDLTVVGNKLTVCPRGAFSEKFYVAVTVSDGIDSDNGGFLVRLGEENPDGPVCEVSTTLHNGEFAGGNTTESFVAEGRIGDSATGAGNRTFEVDVSRTTAGPFAEGETSNYVWVNGKRTPFTLIYDKNNELATFEIDGKVVSHRAVVEQPLTDLLLRTRAVDSSASILLDGLVLNGEQVDKTVEASAVAGGVNVLQIAGGALSSGFTLQGYATMRWGQTGVNIVTNGDFEQPTTSTWNIYTSAEIPGWDVDWVFPDLACPGNSSTDHRGVNVGSKVLICHIPQGNPENAHTISVASSAVAAHLAHGDILGACFNGSPVMMEPVIEIQRGTAVTPAQGNQYAELDSECQGPGQPSTGSKIATVNLSQVLNTQTNKEYDLSFMVRARPGNYGLQTLTVRWNGKDIVSNLPAPNAWTTINIPVVARSNKTLLEFIDTGEANSFGVLLDAVSVVQYTNNEVPKNSGLAFQISVVNVEGAEPCGGGRCESGRVTICHAPPLNTESRRTISVACGDVEEFLRLGATLGSCPVSEEVCEQRHNLVSPTYTLWNSFLGMVNILELVNPTNQPIEVNLSYYSILGQLVHQQPFLVPANGQFDVIVNDFPGFLVDSYGLIKLEFAGGLDGRMMYYRGAPDGVGYDFVFSIALDNSTFGETSVGFNTYQPSMKPEEAANVVANWLNIVNLESDFRTFTVMTYRQDGELLARRVIEVPGFGRRDIDGGHLIAGHNVVGMHVIIPDIRTTEYIAHLTRYGGDAAAGFAPSSFRFAFPLVARQGSSKPIFVPISSQFAEFNWLEVVNILSQTVRVAINLYKSDGTLLESMDAVLGPNSQQHINAATLLARGDVGFASVVPTVPHSIVAQSMFYFRDEATGSVTALYGSQGREGSPCVQSGSYNLFLGMSNYAKLVNTADAEVELTVDLSGGGSSIQKVYVLPAKNSLNLPLRDLAEFGRAPDTYGMLRMQSNNSEAVLFGEVLRLGMEPGGNVDFSAPTLVR